ncbi:MAG: PAQR family membrane homeostasis protein TrhA [Promethearchaeota archaeon]
MSINLPSERFSAYSHLLGAILGLIGTVILIAKNLDHSNYIFIVLIYGFALINMFFSSFLYHSRKKQEDEESIFRKLDHCAIFIMIAGCYTPISYFAVPDPWRWIIIGSQWGLVAIGIIVKFIIINTKRWITTGVYLAQGWMAVLPIKFLWENLTLLMFLMLFLGGMAYSIGAVFYALKKPNPLPGKFGFHEIFHVFILIGATLHYILIYNVVP